VLGIRSFADTLGCSPLVVEADKYIHQYFHDVSMSDEYLSLPCPDLLNIVRKDELHVFSEEQVGGWSMVASAPTQGLYRREN
jgi:kelch-like protein 18